MFDCSEIRNSGQIKLQRVAFLKCARSNYFNGHVALQSTVWLGKQHTGRSDAYDWRVRERLPASALEQMRSDTHRHIPIHLVQVRVNLINAMGSFNANFARQGPIEKCVPSTVSALAISSRVIDADSQNCNVIELMLIRIHNAAITQNGEIVTICAIESLHSVHVEEKFVSWFSRHVQLEADR